jgi:hypothetical protein
MLYRGLVTLYSTQPLELDIDLFLEDDWSTYGLMGKGEWSLGVIGKSVKKKKATCDGKYLNSLFFSLQVDTLWIR